ncbi:hypothetical protein E4U60_006492 [Claviceps pazoutovae]|uniref:Uncharacterized protein n=1 Tax=Claviceps pazoutovae TaxID=1649127 RepID=A0A9P7SJK8_9HYPO|nr:hypothetical protein E4U60_006492 [Claviceps pazoutovae]
MTRSPSPSRPQSASQAQRYMASRAGSPSRTRLSSSSRSSRSSHGPPEQHDKQQQQQQQRKRDLLKDSAGLLLGIGVAAVVAHKVLPKDADAVHDNTQNWGRDRDRDRNRDRDRDTNGRTYRERRMDGEHAPNKKPSGNSSGSLPLVEGVEKSPHGGHLSGDIVTGRRGPIRGRDLECYALKKEDGGLLRGKRGACEPLRRAYPDVELVSVRRITTAAAREPKREEWAGERSRQGERGALSGHRSAERHHVHQRSRIEALACPRDQIRGLEAQQQQQQQQQKQKQRGERHGRPMMYGI